MPYLEKIVVQDYRNIALQELSFSPNINCITGNNGEGKTNLLDAIWYLSMTKSAFAASDRDNFRFGTGAFALSGTYRMESGVPARFSIRVGSGGEKRLVRDDKPCPKVSAHIGTLPIVMVSPADISLISDSGEQRRRFVNAVLSQMDPAYLSGIMQYNRFLQQRNHLLKDGSAEQELFSVIDARLDALAGPLRAARARLADDLRPVVASYYEAVSGGAEKVSIEYRSDVVEGASLAEMLAASMDRDRALRFTSCGLQRDEFVFTMNGHPIRRYGSQGQQKCFLVALKFAQYEIMKRRYGFPPVLLLDDVFDKLDRARIGNLIAMVAGNDFGQIFITDSNKVRLSQIVDSITDECCYYVAEGGAFRPLNAQSDGNDLPAA